MSSASASSSSTSLSVHGNRVESSSSSSSTVSETPEQKQLREAAAQQRVECFLGLVVLICKLAVFAVIVAVVISPLVELYCLAMFRAQEQADADFDGFRPDPCVRLAGFGGAVLSVTVITLIRLFVLSRVARRNALAVVIFAFNVSAIAAFYLNEEPLLNAALTDASAAAIIVGYPCIVPAYNKINLNGMLAQLLHMSYAFFTGIAEDALSGARVSAPQAPWDIANARETNLVRMSYLTASLLSVGLIIAFLCFDHEPGRERHQTRLDQPTTAWAAEHMLCTFAACLCAAFPMGAYTAWRATPVYYLTGALLVTAITAVVEEYSFKQEACTMARSIAMLCVSAAACALACVYGTAGSVKCVQIVQICLFYVNIYDNDVYCIIASAVFVLAQMLCCYVACVRDYAMFLYMADYAWRCWQVRTCMRVLGGFLGLLTLLEVGNQIIVRLSRNTKQLALDVAALAFCALVETAGVVVLSVLCSRFKPGNIEMWQFWGEHDIDFPGAEPKNCPGTFGNPAKDNSNLVTYYSSFVNGGGSVDRNSSTTASRWYAAISNHSLFAETAIHWAQCAVVSTAAFAALYAIAVGNTCSFRRLQKKVNHHIVELRETAQEIPVENSAENDAQIAKQLTEQAEQPSE